MKQAPGIVVERRSVPRQATQARAIAIVNEGVRRGCILSDLSPYGARLVFGAMAPLPLRFELELPGKRLVKVQLIWQRKLAAGVRFNKPLAIWERIAAKA